MKLLNLMTTLSRLRWRIQTPIENLFARCINTHNIQPYGACPVQAEGYLSSGEYYYFRSRHQSWSVRIAKSEESLWGGGAWVYTETKYEEFAGGWIGKLEVVRNFNKAVKLYRNNEHTRSRGDTKEVSQHGVSGKTSTT